MVVPYFFNRFCLCDNIKYRLIPNQPFLVKAAYLFLKKVNIQFSLVDIKDLVGDQERYYVEKWVDESGN